MPRFVILEHDHPELHWDLMLESSPQLRTWRLAMPPRAGEVIAAAAIGDHRLMYLDYEGSVSGNRGCVVRWDHGTFDWHEQTAESVRVRLRGERLRGELQLRQETAEKWSGEFTAEA